MRRLFTISSLLFIVAVLLVSNSFGQGFIEFSKLQHPVTNTSQYPRLSVENGESYILHFTYLGTEPVPQTTVTKYAADGAEVYAVDLPNYTTGVDSFFNYFDMKVVNGEVYLCGSGAIGSAVVKLNTNGSIAFNTVFSDAYLGAEGILIAGNEIILTGTDRGNSFPVTMGPPAPALNYNGILVKISTSDGSITKAMYMGFKPDFMKIDNDAAYFTPSMDWPHDPVQPVTMGAIPLTASNGPGDFLYIRKINLGDFSTVYARYVSDSATTQLSALEILNGEVHLFGTTYSANYPVTNGTTHSADPLARNGFYTRLNADGSIGVSTYLNSPGSHYYSDAMKIVNGNVYLSGMLSNMAQTSYEAFVSKLTGNGSMVYFRHFSLDNYSPHYYARLFEVVNDELYIAGSGIGPGYPVTNGSVYPGANSAHFTHLDATGNILFAGYLGTVSTSGLYAKLYNNRICLAGSTLLASLPATDGSTIKGNFDNVVTVLETDGSTVFRGYIGGEEQDNPIAIEADNSGVYIHGASKSIDYPVTDNAPLQGAMHSFLTKIAFCPGHYATANDTLSPKVQTACKYGVGNIIRGLDIILPGDSLPTIFVNGVATLQSAAGITNYQWQKAPASTGPWTDIPNATVRDFLPSIAASDQYYRRLVFMPASCGSALIHTSDTAVVLAGTLTAPALNAGDQLVTCPSSAVNIGGSPTATGGNPPYAYNWDMGLPAIANPPVSPLVNTIYTLMVTDAGGCKQIDQAIVLVYKADAGMDKINCGGSSVRIGAAPIPALPGVQYAWQPATDLSSAVIAQPFANPTVTTDYDLTLTIPKSGGGTCVTFDTVRVTPVTAPLIQDFAGLDRTTCTGSTISIGSPGEPGFTYSWNPESKLININGSTADYFQSVISYPDPVTFRLYAYKNGCTFSDDITVTTIQSNAGRPWCGPTLIGWPDLTPDVNETYSWVKVSGPGNFTGATNLPQVPVSASVGGSTTYGLTVSHNGVNCYSEVMITESCTIAECKAVILVDATYSCPGYDINNGHVTLIACSAGPDFTYAWTPQVGLSAYFGNTVQLTDNIPRTYTLTVTNVLDTSIHCSTTINVNDPGFAAPSFPAPDTATCTNMPVMIGLPAVAGYTYAWTGAGLSDYQVSNPIATTNYSINYVVEITNQTGCALIDTVLVTVQNIHANAGSDRIVCNNALLMLGTPQQPNTNYLWEPQATAWQNGTNQFTAQPEVLAATSVTYTVTTTTSAGCVTTDEMHITVNNSPTIPNAPDVSVCLGGNGRVIGSPALAGVSYQWSPTTGLDDPNLAQPTANPLVTTTYTVTATFAGDCILPVSDQVTVTVMNPVFNMPDIHYCPANGAVNIGVNAPPGMIWYIWQPTNLIVNAAIANAFTIDPPPNTNTVFRLRTLNAFGCIYTDTITIIPFTQAPVAGPDRTVCKDQPVNIGSALNPTGPSISYSWNPIVNLNDPTNPNPVFTGTVPGTFQYVLTKTDNTIPCSVNDTIVINVVDIVPALNSPTVCRNSCVQVGTNPVNGFIYQWSPENGLSDPAIANPIACIDTVAATYTLTINNLQGCSTTANVVIGVNAAPGVQVSVPGITACTGDNVMFNPVVPPGSYSYLWSPDDGTLSNINIPNPLIAANSPGTTQYLLQITDNTTGCTNTVTANVTVNDCPPNATAGNFMWFDTNENGLQDNAEQGVSGTVVKLYNNIGFNVATTVTDAYGGYDFSNIPPGNDYYIIFGKPAGYLFTTQYVGGITAPDNSKADINGRTGNFNLLTAATISNMDAGIKPGQAVPISLLGFTARLQGNKVLLNWQTTAEMNNDYFDVEKSNDGINFSAIGRVDGNGTTFLPHSYSLVDPRPLPGINYYRLRQVDFDGHFTFSHVEAVTLKNTNETITAWYNNPTNSIQLLFSKSQNNVVVKLYASNGQLIKRAATTNNITSYTLNLPELPAGIYMLQVVSDKERYSEKIFISK